MDKGCVLAIDHDALQLQVLEEQLIGQGYRVLPARGGEEGLAALETHVGQVDAVLIERRMAGLDGIHVAHRIKDDSALHLLPIVILTQEENVQDMRDGLEAGALYYLVKPIDGMLLDAVLGAAIREKRQHHRLQAALANQKHAIAFMDTARFSCTSHHDAEALAALIACCFPEPTRVVTGLAELMFNALEHGNWGIGYQEKTRLLASGEWELELNRRAQLPEHLDKQVEVIFQRKADGAYVQITDHGNGFDWEPYLKIDPSRATHNHGRGIAQARAQSFDELRYNDKGNQVLAMVALDPSRSRRLHW